MLEPLLSQMPGSGSAWCPLGTLQNQQNFHTRQCDLAATAADHVTREYRLKSCESGKSGKFPCAKLFLQSMVFACCEALMSLDKEPYDILTCFFARFRCQIFSRLTLCMGSSSQRLPLALNPCECVSLPTSASCIYRKWESCTAEGGWEGGIRHVEKEGTWVCEDICRLKASPISDGW